MADSAECPFCAAVRELFPGPPISGNWHYWDVIEYFITKGAAIIQVIPNGRTLEAVFYQLKDAKHWAHPVTLADDVDEYSNDIPLSKVELIANFTWRNIETVSTNMHAWLPEYRAIFVQAPIYDNSNRKFLIGDDKESLFRLIRDGAVKLSRDNAKRLEESVISITGMPSPDVRFPIGIDTVKIEPDFLDSISEEKREYLKVFDRIYNSASNGKGALKKVHQRINMMIAGIPGSGKTYFAAMIARVIRTSSVLKISFNCYCWREIITTCPSRTVVVLDDIDTAFTSREENPHDKVHFSLSSLLTLLDSHRDKQLVFLLTTNHPEKIDQAVYRSERITLFAEFGWATEGEKRYIIKDFFPDDVDTVLATIGKIKCTHGMITTLCRKAWALERLPQAEEIQAMKMESARLEQTYISGKQRLAYM